MKGSLKYIGNVFAETGLLSAIWPQYIPILMLHRVNVRHMSTPASAIDVDYIEDCLAHLRRKRFKFMTLPDFYSCIAQEKDIPTKSIVITADDGFKDQAFLALDIFHKYSVPLNLFVITGFLDGALWPWDDQVAFGMARTAKSQICLPLPNGKMLNLDLSDISRKHAASTLRDRLKSDTQTVLYDWLVETFYPTLQVNRPDSPPPEYTAMSWTDARDMVLGGHGVYPHTVSHRILSQLSASEKRQEIIQSRDRLSEELRYAPRFFAYPTGRAPDFDAETIDFLNRSGFSLAFTTEHHYSTPKGDHYRVPRFSFPENNQDLKQIMFKLEAAKYWLRRTVSLRPLEKR